MFGKSRITICREGLYYVVVLSFIVVLLVTVVCIISVVLPLAAGSAGM